MKAKTKQKIWAVLGTLIMIFPFFLGLGQVKTNAAEEATEQNVTIHKMAYDDKLPEEKPNTGGEMTDFGGTPLAGAEFKAYDVTAAYWKAYDEAIAVEGTTDTDASKAAIDAVKGDTSLQVEANVKATFLTGEDGSDNKDLPILSGGKKAVYLFVETKSPAGVVQGESDPFVLGLPVYDDETDELRDTVHVYPKNVIKDLTLGFTKYGVAEDGTTATVLDGATFALKNAAGEYYNPETGAFDSDTQVVAATSGEKGEKGLVTIDNLVLDPGDYVFEEITAPDPYHIGINPVVYVHVSENMEVTYDYYDINQDMTEATKGQSTGAKAYNYEVPTPEKTVNDDKDYIGQVFTYTITQKIPNDVATYTQFDLVDTPDSRLALVSTDAEILGSVQIGGATASDVIPTITHDGDKFTVHFTPSQLAKYAGKEITFTVNMKIKPGADLATDINNEIKFDNNFNDKIDNEVVQTNGKKFIKKEANTGNALEGAGFVIKNSEGKYLQLVDADGNKVDTVSGYSDDYEIKWVDTEAEATILTSDAEGKFGIAGLAGDETYTLIETVVPDGYVTPNENPTFEPDGGTAELEIVNQPKGVLPSTGGKGIIAFVAIGVALVGGVGFYFMKRSKSTEA